MLPTSAAWPALLVVSRGWLGCCFALLWCCVRDMMRQCEQLEKLPAHDEELGTDDASLNYTEEQDYVQMLHDSSAFASPVPIRLAAISHAHYPHTPLQSRPPGLPRSNYAAASTAPTEAGAWMSRPIRAWSDAAVLK